ncbi:MAG: serine/threonine protein kinase [Ktedonobacteraceae bacterium]|nr:serine/threonine protein kinase [Ktedonobacteraceae bacterium]
MNAEALIGTVLGTCTLQKLIGQGGMGAVYLAQQSRPRRQVAVKVLLPMTPLSPNQLAAFLERFRRETDAAASLDHPNIMPVHEYGERDGLAYLVMPYISGGTLRDLFEREGQLPLDRVVNYLDQLTSAIDAAHERGVVHRDIKPANIMVTPEGRLLLTDFGLVKITAEGRIPQIRLTGPGAPVGTPDYMAPEQVIGEEVDTRADLYSLGVILYQMVTGTTPFQGESPMQIAAQHLQIPPPSPQMLRPDLPIEAEQVILRALAKRPADRYARAQDLALAFRAALAGAGIPLVTGTGGLPVVPPSGATGRLFVQKGSLDLNRPTSTMTAVNRSTSPFSAVKRDNGGAGDAGDSSRLHTGMMPRVTGAMPAAIPPGPANAIPGSGGGLLSRTGKFPQIGKITAQLSAVSPASGQFPVPPTHSGRLGNAEKVENAASTGALSAAKMPTADDILGPPSAFAKEDRAALFTAASESAMQTTGPSMMKLSGPVKVVQVPVAGQPGRYITGLLPVTSLDDQEQQSSLSVELPAETGKIKRAKGWLKWVSIAVVVLIVLGGALSFLALRSQMGQQAKQKGASSVLQSAGTPDVRATANAQATATVQANVLFRDPLDHNTNGWPVTPPELYSFKDGAYHISVQGNKGGGAVLPNMNFGGEPMVYSLTMQEIKGNDNAGNNTFGMIFRYSEKKQGNTVVNTFYSLEVENVKGGNYHFWKYDSSKGNGPDAWKELWHAPFGKEFHQGQGAQAVNTFKIYMNKDTFTFSVNNQKVNATIKDGSYPEGKVGMIVNLNGTEVAFKDLAVTRN